MSIGLAALMHVNFHAHVLAAQIQAAFSMMQGMHRAGA